MFWRLEAWIQEQDFNPGVLGLFINPFYFARKGLHQHVLALAPHVRGKILDVGCGSKPYQKFFDASEYIGLDIEGRNPQADLHYNGKIFPFDSGEFDAVLTSQVLEHVFNPNEFLSEVNRVLRDDGVLLLTVPFVWDEHEQPFDYARYSSFGLRHLLDCHGFEVLEHRKSINDLSVICQLINAYIYKKTVTDSISLNLFFTIVLMAPFNFCGLVLGKVLPNNSDLYLDNIVLARKRKSLQ